MTSNLGTADLRKATVGFGKADEAVTYEKMKEKVTEELKRSFRPEFLNRIDEVIVFNELTPGRGHRDRRPAHQAGAGAAREPGPRPRAHQRRQAAARRRRATTRRSAPGRCGGRSSAWSRTRSRRRSCGRSSTPARRSSSTRSTTRSSSGRSRGSSLRRSSSPGAAPKELDTRSLLQPIRPRRSLARTARAPVCVGCVARRARRCCSRARVQGRHHGHGRTCTTTAAGVVDASPPTLDRRGGRRRPRSGGGKLEDRVRLGDLADAGWTVAAVGAQRRRLGADRRCRSRSSSPDEVAGIVARAERRRTGRCSDVTVDAGSRRGVSTSYSVDRRASTSPRSAPASTADQELVQRRSPAQQVDVERASTRRCSPSCSDAVRRERGGRAARTGRAPSINGVAGRRRPDRRVDVGRSTRTASTLVVDRGRARRAR